MDLRPKVVLVRDGHEITIRQLEALAALNEKGSLKRAAEHLGIATPVLYKYVKEVEEKADSTLLRSTSRGTKLTEDGLELLRLLRSRELRLEDDAVLHVAGTLVSERCVLTAASAVSEKGAQCRVTISTDEENLRLMDERRVDCIVLDDAIYAMDRSPECDGTEVASDVLLYKDNGRRFVRLAFGAQRLAFRYLEQKQVPHEIVRTVFEPALLDQIEYSYFVNRSLVRRGIVRASGAKEQKWSSHSIMAIPCSEHADLEVFLSEVRRVGLYPKG